MQVKGHDPKMLEDAVQYAEDTCSEYGEGFRRVAKRRYRDEQGLGVDYEDAQPPRNKSAANPVDQLDWSKLGLGFGGDESPPKFDRKGIAVSSWSKTAKKDPLSIAALQALIMTRSDAQETKQAAKATKAKVLEVKAEAHDEINRADEQPQRENVDGKTRVEEADEEVADEDIEADEVMEAVVEVDLDITGLRLTDLPSWSRRRIPDAVTATKLVTGGENARTEQQCLTKYLTHGNSKHRQSFPSSPSGGASSGGAGIEYPNGNDKKNDAEPASGNTRATKRRRKRRERRSGWKSTCGDAVGTDGRSKEKSGGTEGQNWGKSSKPSEVTGNEAAEAVEERTKTAGEDDEQKEQGSPVEVVDLASVAATGGSQAEDEAEDEAEVIAASNVPGRVV
ncbi:putative Polyprotein [Phytophthora megakarya]|uniref:Putative Polyprotein n=1 Tax=Phytophthora megakarya TaxID=4795 RepID=A0A225WWN8_9STRA|nr:putative Polyprotein [Phytophthora megakarya]